MKYYSIAAYNNLFYGRSNFYLKIDLLIIHLYLALLNGYDYKRVTAPPALGYHSTWIKIAHLYDLLHKYDIVVLFDGDAYIRRSNISIEFLMKEYNFTSNSSILMPVDPDFKQNQDSRGRITLNTGFIIAQNNNLTKRILKELAQCADIFPNCTQWRHEWSYEQRAFSDYFRDQMKIGSELIMAPCNDLNGFDNSGSGCVGRYVAHVWSAKHTIKDRLKNVMLESLMLILNQTMWNDRFHHVASTSDVKQLGS